MTPNQKIQFNRMVHALGRISREFQTPDQLKRKGAKEIGLDYVEALEMSYENIQLDAKQACKGVKQVP